MFEYLSIASFLAFLTFPVALLAVRFLRPRWMPWWLLVPAVMVVGWIVVNAGVHFRYQHLGDLLRATPNPSQALIDEATADGAPRIFALLLGWAYGPAYLLPWLIPYGLCQLLRRLIAQPGGPKDGGPATRLGNVSVTKGHHR
jgi:hypothetical protein